MFTRHQLFDRIATLFAYPPPGYLAAVEDVRAAIRAAGPEVAERIDAFADGLGTMDRAAIEELFTRTFDLNPECSCEVGWHLFGERYDRGSFMVWMRDQLRVHDVPETGELPDHLVHVLRVLGRMDDEEAQRFATEAVTPTLERMVGSVKDPANPFRDLIAAIARWLVVEFGAPRWRCEEGAWQEGEPAALAPANEE